jgi:type IV pilus assembly protein PilY1
MKSVKILIHYLLVAAMAAPILLHAEDIDIYDKISDSGDRPNVLLVLDNAANFSASAGNCTYDDDHTAPSLNGTAGGIEQCAFYNVINGLDVASNGEAKINLGMMFYNANGLTGYGCASGGNGGCLVRPIVPMTAANKQALLTWIRSWVTSGNSINNIKASSEQTGATMQEAWAYFAGKTGLSGRNYASIQPANSGCQNNFVIFVGNAFTNSGTPGEGGNASPSSALNTAPGVTAAQKLAITIPSGCYGTFGRLPFKTGTSTCTLPTPSATVFSCGSYTMGNHTDSSGLYADEWARYMAQTDTSGVNGGKTNITTYTVGLIGNSCKPDYPALMKSMADFGGGKYFPTSNYSQIKEALLKIFNEVQAVNSVFSSSSLPVSVNTQGSYLNQIYMGMFRPDVNGSPRWVGNLKQYKFKFNTNLNMVQLADSTGADAISSGSTGFLSPNAVSFWTTKNIATVPDSTGGFWKNNPQGVGLAYDSPDGEVVEKGGAAQQLRLANLTSNFSATAQSGENPRKLYTYCPGGSNCSNELTDSANIFAASNSAITADALGVSSTARDTLINWVRGEDNTGAEKGPGGTVTVRPSIHGDALHSRPVVLSYGGSPESIVVFYGTNDGVFRAVNGNQTSSIGSVPPGGELWGLVLPEFYSKLKRQRDNTPLVKFPNTDPDLNPQPKDYFVDGSPGVYQKLKADGTIDKSYIYLTMRRGGRFMYALDVTTPTNPKVMWKKSFTDTGMAELGQTWGRPRLAVVKGWSNPVLIIGAGYSTTQDSEPPLTDTMGRGIFILDAVTGNVVWKAGPSAGATACSGTSSSASCAVADMNYSIPADITPLDRDFDGYVERLYAVDMGGNIWRVDLEPTAGSTPDKWTVNKLAALGCGTGACASGTIPRKFFFGPSVVPVGVPGSTTAYDLVMVGSGDREHPTYNISANSAYSVTNRLYAVKDLKTGKDATGLTTVTESSLRNATSADYDGTGSGYFITLNTGEKAVNAPVTVGGTAYFGTNQPTAPSANSCASDLGTARSYSVDLFTGKYRSTELNGGGLPPSPVSGIVVVDGTKVGFCIGCVNPESPKKSPLDNGTSDKEGKKKISRTYWYKK